MPTPDLAAPGLSALVDVPHAIQVALTPVFLISGIGALLNVFNTRLARVSDHSEHINDLLKSETDTDARATLERQLARLRRRTAALDLAVALAAIGGATTCAAAFALFVVTARDAGGGFALILLFGAALLFTVAALTAFVADTVLAWHGIRLDGLLPLPRRLIRLVR